MDKFREIMQSIRSDRHITLRDMADMIRISAGYLSQIESGKRAVPKDFYEKIKLAFELNIYEDNELRIALNNARPQIFDYDPEELKRQLVALSIQLASYVEQALTDLINKTIARMEEIIAKIKEACNNHNDESMNLFGKNM